VPGRISPMTPAPRPGLPRWVAPIVVALFVLVPIVEIAVIIAVGRAIGPWWTILLLIVESAIGAWIVKREGTRAWRSLSEAFAAGGVPDRQLVDGALVVAGGTLLLTPGFVTDIAGFLLVLPFTRPAIRALVMTVMVHRARGFIGVGRVGGGPRGTTSTDPRNRGAVPGEVVDRHDDPA
jgi:UPF0716 protein FxsA